MYGSQWIKLVGYLSYQQGQRGAEAEGNLVGKTPHFPEHAAVICFWRDGELTRVDVIYTDF